MIQSIPASINDTVLILILIVFLKLDLLVFSIFETSKLALVAYWVLFCPNDCNNNYIIFSRMHSIDKYFKWVYDLNMNLFTKII